jgi:hypothetical protein
MGMPSELPAFCDWNAAAIHLLQGVVEADDTRLWNTLLSNRSQLETYFAHLGVLLVVDESEGFAYLRQLRADETPAGYESLPKLFRSSRLSYGQTVLCILLREALRRFEDEDTLNERCVVQSSDLFDAWKSYFASHGDDVKLLRELSAGLRKLEELGLVKKFGAESESWEVCRIMKARLNAEQLEHLQQSLLAALPADDPIPATRVET